MTGLSFVLGVVVFKLRTDGREAMAVGFDGGNEDLGDVVVVVVVDLVHLQKV